MDDYPLHQISDTIRHVGTSDRNFYDRYDFNLHACSGEIFMVMGMGQSPNLAVQDAFAVVRRAREQRVVRASRVLGDRMDTSVGPFRIEVIEGLRRVLFDSMRFAQTGFWQGRLVVAGEELECYVGIGTGHGFDADWRHGMYQGPLEVQGLVLDSERDRAKLWGLCDNAARFEMGSLVGYGLHDDGFFGPFDRYRLPGFLDGQV